MEQCSPLPGALSSTSQCFHLGLFMEKLRSVASGVDSSCLPEADSVYHAHFTDEKPRSPEDERNSAACLTPTRFCTFNGLNVGSGKVPTIQQALLTDLLRGT